MANNYNEILALVNAGNQMGLSNTIKRDYGIPLDFTSVQPNMDEAVKYAATSTKAYIGQPISVGSKLYIITDTAAAEKYVIGEDEYDNYLAEVGSATEGDGVTIDLESGILTLHGFDSALSGYLPRKSEDGTLEWVPISAVVQGDGNKVTTLTSTDGSVEITKTTDTDESLVYDLKVTPYDDSAIAGRVKAIEDDYLKTADKYDDTALAARVKALEDEERYDETPLANRVGALETAVNHEETGLAAHEDRLQVVEAFFSAIEDSDETINTLKEIQEYIASDETGAAAMADSIKANADAIKVLNGDGEGSVAKSIEDAVAPVRELADAAQTAEEVASAIATAITNENLGQYAKADEVNAELAKKIENGSIAHTSEGVAEGVTVDDKTLKIVVDSYTKKEVRDYVADVIEDMTGGESAADVKLMLENHIETYDAKVAEIDAKDAAQDASITAAQQQADKGVADAKTAKDAADAAALAVTNLADGQVTINKNAIAALQTLVAGEEETSHTKRLAALEAHDLAHQSEFNGLTTTVNELATLVGKKANAADVYTKTEADGKFLTEHQSLENYYTKTQADAAVKAITGTPAEGKTLVQMIEDAQTAATYDDTQVKADIKANTDAIAALVGDEGTIAKAVAAEKARAEGEEAKLDGRLKEVETFFAAVEEPDEVINTLAEIVSYIESDKSGAAELTGKVNQNTTDIAALVQRVGANETAISTTLPAAIAAAEAAAKKYTDDNMVKADGTSIKNTNGTFSVGQVSTDNLVNGADTLVLFGGKATI